MPNRKPQQIFRSRPAAGRALIALCFTLTLITTQAQAQTFKALHVFSSGKDGGKPLAGLTMDAAGNLYGTTSIGGRAGGCYGAGCGTVFKLAHAGSGWLLSTLYTFAGGSDGQFPNARIIFGPDGSLYGTTSQGGCCSGTVFNVKPPTNSCKTAVCPWTKTTIYQFTGGNDGSAPTGDLVFDGAGNLYGVTTYGGAGGGGTVYKLVRSGGTWTQSVLYSFLFGGTSGYLPFSGVILDGEGRLYGTTSADSGAAGTVYQLTSSGAGWTENVLYAFQARNDGDRPIGGLIFDGSGYLYGTTSDGGAGGGGTVFRLLPAGGGWVYDLLCSFIYNVGSGGPRASLTMDSAGHFFGTNLYDGNYYQEGEVFEMANSGAGWGCNPLHEFIGNDGGRPYSNVVLDNKGNLYGTASEGGTQGGQYCATCGVVWEITP